MRPPVPRQSWGQSIAAAGARGRRIQRPAHPGPACPGRRGPARVASTPHPASGRTSPPPPSSCRPCGTPGWHAPRSTRHSPNRRSPRSSAACPAPRRPRSAAPPAPCRRPGRARPRARKRYPRRSSDTPNGRGTACSRHSPAPRSRRSPPARTSRAPSPCRTARSFPRLTAVPPRRCPCRAARGGRRSTGCRADRRARRGEPASRRVLLRRSVWVWRNLSRFAGMG